MIHKNQFLIVNCNHAGLQATTGGSHGPNGLHGPHGPHTPPVGPQGDQGRHGEHPGFVLNTGGALL